MQNLQTITNLYRRMLTKILEADNSDCPLHQDSKAKLRHAKEFLFNELN